MYSFLLDTIQLPTKRHRKSAPDTWEKNVVKLARLEGRAYTNRKDDVMPARKMGVTCNSESCRKSSLRHCFSFSAVERGNIFDTFWKMGSWTERKTFIKMLIETVATKQFKAGQASARTLTYNYFLKNSAGEEKQVCKNMFAATVGLSVKTISNWLENDKEGERQEVEGQENPNTISTKLLTAADKKFLEDWLQAIPTVPSHYCRKQPSYEGKKFIHPGKTIRSLHMDYVTECTNANMRAA